MTMIFFDCEKKPSDYFSIISKNKKHVTLDLYDIFRVEFLLNLQELLQLAFVLII